MGEVCGDLIVRLEASYAATHKAARWVVDSDGRLVIGAGERCGVTGADA